MFLLAHATWIGSFCWRRSLDLENCYAKPFRNRVREDVISFWSDG